MRKLFFNTVLPILFIGGLTVFGISVGNIYYGSLGDNNVFADTLDDPPAGVWFNVGGMFNERGFSTSNSISYDENEIINNFNGNLQYSFPLYHYDGPGDLDFDMSLNYNGAIAHTLFAADSLVSTMAGVIPQHNFNVPGWIFSINGIAVQTLNFETKMFTQKTSGQAENKQVNLLMTGYQVTDRKDPANYYDYINLLMGDGSLLRLENKVNGQGTHVSTGDYYAVNRKDYTKAIVTYRDTLPGDSACKNRRIELLRGDGLTFIFKEYGIDFYDAPAAGMECYDSAQVIRLDSVIDRFGNAMTLQYNDYASLRGRPTLERIDFPGWSSQCRYIEFIYNPFINNVGEISVGNDVDGYYEIFTTGFTFAAFDNSNDHRAMVTRIMGLNNDTLGAFQYQDYNRTETNLAYSPSSTFTVKFDNGHLKRMSKFTNKNGGEKIYTYKGSITSTMDMSVPGGQYGIHSSDFYGQGRDAFFENMIEKVEYKQGTDTYKKIEYSYPFSDNGTSFAEEPVDASDDYRTEQFTINLTTDTIETPSKIGTKYYYKNYKIFNLAQNLMENYDFPGETKLLKEEQFKGEPESLIKTVEYFANIEGPVGTYSTYGGSFLDTLIKETINGAVKESEYKYEFFSDYPFTGATYKNPIKKITTIDPFDNKSVVEYEKMDGISKHYNDGRYILGVSTYKETPFFNLNLPKYEETYDNADNLTAKTNYSYIWGNDTDSGYIGQLVSTKIIDPSNGNIFKEFQNEFYKKDTVGEWMYVQAGEHKPGTEGNLKKTIDPSGNEKYFYYNPISFSESSLLGNRDEIDYFGEYYDTTDAMGQLPRVAYYKAYENGTITVSNSLWHDRRMPTRTDAFVSPGYSLTEYNLYTASGNLLNNINPNRYLSSFSYDALNRITHAVAPHDLAPFVQDTIIDTVIETVAIDTLTNLVGAYDYVTDSFFYKNMSDNSASWLTFSGFFNIFTENNYIEESILQQRLPLIGFPTDLFKEFISIDSASLILYPYQLNRHTNSDTSISYVRMIIRAVDSFSVSGPLVINPNSSNQYQVSLPQDQPEPICSTAVYQEKEFDIKDLLTMQMITQGKQFAGVQLDLTHSGLTPTYTHYYMKIGGNVYDDYGGCVSFNTWKANYAPRIKVYGKRRKITTYIKNELSNANYNFEYADDSNKVRTLTKLSVGNYKKNETIFDGFYRPIQNKMYTGASSFNSTTTEYNYLDKPSTTTDGRGIETKFSYDEFGNVKKTENPADTSASLMTSTFQNGLSYHWGSVSGIVNKQVFEDEIGNKFVKFFDMVGNLRREVKFVDAGTPSSPLIDSLITDYRYDSLYRVTNVITPNSKVISYKYDAFGRQKERTTVDAGTENFRYDKSDNLRFSMDAVQSGPNNFTFRGYDGTNRLLYIGTGNLTFESTRYNWTDLNPDTTYSFEKYSVSPGNFLTVNVYDTLSTSVASGLFSPPGDYYSVKNNTKGNLIATAYRTRTSDNWNFKYYRYDGKGRVIKMWSVLDGLGTKIFDYIYNSSDQPAYMTYQYGDSTGFKKFRYDYDDAGRLSDVKLYDPQNPAGDTSDAVGQYSVFASYKYNENSMIDTVKYNNGGYLFENIYNNRNWLYQINDHIPDKLKEVLLYEKNGNIKNQVLAGTYDDNMFAPGPLTFTYTYDKSNRLTGVDQAYGDEWDMQNTYDKDGNLTAMTRNDSKGNIEDNFSYAYYTGTNKLSHVTGSSAQFSYDANGNVLSDQLSEIYNMKYDFRNLMTEYSYVYSENYNAVTRMWYDEDGNRIRKVSVINFVGGGGGGEIPDWDSLESFPPYDDQAEPPAGEGGGDNWQMLTDERYVRDVEGNEVAIYNSYDLKQWNVNKEGKIDADQKKYFFLKDHLGTVRAVIDTAYNVVESNDVDIWGYRLMDREYTTSITDNDYIFTGKERDDEKSGYDYFGARYLNSRIGRWSGIDPLMEKHYDFNPYNYVLSNPLRLVDPDGKQIESKHLQDPGGSILPLRYILWNAYNETLIKPSLKNFKGGNELNYQLTSTMLEADFILQPVAETVQNIELVYLGLQLSVPAAYIGSEFLLTPALGVLGYTATESFIVGEGLLGGYELLLKMWNLVSKQEAHDQYIKDRQKRIEEQKEKKVKSELEAESKADKYNFKQEHARNKWTVSPARFD